MSAESPLVKALDFLADQHNLQPSRNRSGWGFALQGHLPTRRWATLPEAAAETLRRLELVEVEKQTVAHAVAQRASIAAHALRGLANQI